MNKVTLVNKSIKLFFPFISSQHHITFTIFKNIHFFVAITFKKKNQIFENKKKPQTKVRECAESENTRI